MHSSEFNYGLWLLKCAGKNRRENKYFFAISINIMRFYRTIGISYTVIFDRVITYNSRDCWAISSDFKNEREHQLKIIKTHSSLCCSPEFDCCCMKPFMWQCNVYMFYSNTNEMIWLQIRKRNINTESNAMSKYANNTQYWSHLFINISQKTDSHTVIIFKQICCMV